MEVPFSDLLGQHIVTWGISKDHGEMFIGTTEGNWYRMYHSQDCCESVYLESIVGDMQDLFMLPLLVAEEVVHTRTNPEGVTAPEYQDSFTWTFYKLATLKGHVDLRWYGDSNGYYSEGVSLELLEAGGVPAGFDELDKVLT